jgi:hypothetical protein
MPPRRPSHHGFFAPAEQNEDIMKNINFSTTGSVTSTLVFGNQISPDVYSFFAQEGERIRLETSNTTVDTTVRVVGPDAAIDLFDDDGGDGLASRLVFTAADTGTYIAVVSSFSGNPGGGNYTLNFARGAAALQALHEAAEDAGQGISMPEFENRVEVKTGR